MVMDEVEEAEQKRHGIADVELQFGGLQLGHRLIEDCDVEPAFEPKRIDHPDRGARLPAETPDAGAGEAVSGELGGRRGEKRIADALESSAPPFRGGRPIRFGLAELAVPSGPCALPAHLMGGLSCVIEQRAWPPLLAGRPIITSRAPRAREL